VVLAQGSTAVPLHPATSEQLEHEVPAFPQTPPGHCEHAEGSGVPVQVPLGAAEVQPGHAQPASSPHAAHVAKVGVPTHADALDPASPSVAAS
jgi:hypothetical protein